MRQLQRREPDLRQSRLVALLILMVGAFCAVLSIMISRKGVYQSAWSSFGLMTFYHDQRRRWFNASAR